MEFSDFISDFLLLFYFFSMCFESFFVVLFVVSLVPLVFVVENVGDQRIMSKCLVTSDEVGEGRGGRGRDEEEGGREGGRKVGTLYQLHPK